MDPGRRASAAGLLLDAYASGKPIEPLSETFQDLTLEDAYAIQLLQIRSRLDGGATIKGHKVGLTSVAMQRQMGVDQPDYGHLLDDMFHSEYEPIPIGAYLQPRVEPEIAFVLRSPLRGPGVTTAQAAAAVDFVLPAIELIDSRIRDWRIGLLDTIADNASSGGVVLGRNPTPLSEVDLRLSGCTVHVNSRLAATGAGGAVLGSPLNSLVWLANTVGALGVTLEAGHVILPGSVTAAIPVAASDVVSVRFAGLGSVSARFGAGEGGVPR
ncbi:fumarylacetoacetate hydrolase family protein [Nonomuraea sp. NPDC048916]|uniref:2-keto-4-pentenoate hydratase n=1 Tax=Nonomuraea sp. NPDC048916 TaxID=3154232 RepID=UPI0033C23EC0